MSGELLDLQAIGAETIAEYAPVGSAHPEAREGMGLDTSRSLIAEALAEIEYAERYESEDDDPDAEALAPVEVPRFSSQAGLAALRYGAVA